MKDKERRSVQIVAGSKQKRQYLQAKCKYKNANINCALLSGLLLRVGKGEKHSVMRHRQRATWAASRMDRRGSFVLLPRSGLLLAFWHFGNHHRVLFSDQLQTLVRARVLLKKSSSAARIEIDPPVVQPPTTSAWPRRVEQKALNALCQKQLARHRTAISQVLHGRFAAGQPPATFCSTCAWCVPLDDEEEDAMHGGSSSSSSGSGSASASSTAPRPASAPRYLCRELHRADFCNFGFGGGEEPADPAQEGRQEDRRYQRQAGSSYRSPQAVNKPTETDRWIHENLALARERMCQISAHRACLFAARLQASLAYKSAMKAYKVDPNVDGRQEHDEQGALLAVIQIAEELERCAPGGSSSIVVDFTVRPPAIREAAGAQSRTTTMVPEHDVGYVAGGNGFAGGGGSAGSGEQSSQSAEVERRAATREDGTGDPPAAIDVPSSMDNEDEEDVEASALEDFRHRPLFCRMVLQHRSSEYRRRHAELTEYDTQTSMLQKNLMAPEVQDPLGVSLAAWEAMMGNKSGSSTGRAGRRKTAFLSPELVQRCCEYI